MFSSRVVSGAGRWGKTISGEYVSDTKNVRIEGDPIMNNQKFKKAPTIVPGSQTSRLLQHKTAVIRRLSLGSTVMRIARDYGVDRSAVYRLAALCGFTYLLPRARHRQWLREKDK
jgi:hypothetical protein